MASWRALSQVVEPKPSEKPLSQEGDSFFGNSHHEDILLMVRDLLAQPPGRSLSRRRKNGSAQERR